MNSVLIAAPLGIAAALAHTAADASAQPKEALEPEPREPPTADLLPLDSPAPDLLDPEPPQTAAEREASDPTKLCDDKCKVVVLTETILPNTGVADLVSIALQPEEHGLDIPKSDGTPAVTLTINPIKITRGEGLVATARF